MLRAYERLAPPGMTLEHYDGLGTLPHFNPDLDCEPLPAEVAALRRAVASADVLVVSTPEYMHALPGSFKNALDWLTSDPAFVGKPVVILHAERGSTWALDSLKEVLGTMSARIVESASALLPLGTNTVDEETILAREDLQGLLARSVEVLAREESFAG